ncbi:MAG: hypothetical protein SFV15_05760 [Polyangiaceae bacterium]|nr:hypothetical protein [Polyangiaceae bacterium]
MLGARFEVGSTFSYGLFYSYDMEWSHSTDGAGASVYGGIGAAVTLTTEQHSGIDGVVVGPLLRGGVAGDAGLPLEFEFHPGVAIDGGSVCSSLAAGAFAGYRYFGIGYLFGFAPFPSCRPAWLANHRFALRAAVPVHSSETRTISTVTP